MLVIVALRQDYARTVQRLCASSTVGDNNTVDIISFLVKRLVWTLNTLKRMVKTTNRVLIYVADIQGTCTKSGFFFKVVRFHYQSASRNMTVNFPQTYGKQ